MGSKKIMLIETENRLVVARGRGLGVGKVSEGGEKVQTSSHKINEFWGSYLQHSDYSLKIIIYPQFRKHNNSSIKTTNNDSQNYRIYLVIIYKDKIVDQCFK